MSSDQLTGMMSEEDFLEHFGVKGMKWGKRGGAAKTGPDGNPAKSRKELRGLDKASRQKDASDAREANKKLNKEMDSEIDAARGRQKSGENRQMVKDAKAQYKIDKAVIGKREAKKALTAVKDKAEADYYTSQIPKSGKEAVISTVASLAAIGILAYASN